MLAYERAEIPENTDAVCYSIEYSDIAWCLWFHQSKLISSPSVLLDRIALLDNSSETIARDNRVDRTPSRAILPGRIVRSKPV